MKTERNPQYDGEVNAPEFPAGLDWLNTDGPLSLRALRGKIVLLDFWTYCCINCQHVLPELKKLERKYADQLVVIGVHSPKFPAEKITANVRQAVLRHDIEHPVVNDQDMETWRQYAVRAWPTLIIINPKGKIVGAHAGEGTFELFDDLLAGLAEYFRTNGELNETPLALQPEKAREPRGALRYPGKILADEKNGRLFISDSGANRIVITTMDGRMLDVIGSGAEGMQDGAFAVATFHHPQGLALDDDILYICDTENHAIRRADLRARTVTRIAGTGEQARMFNDSGVDVSLNSPWDAVVFDDILYVAMAGPHQIWTIDLATRHAGPYAGSGHESHMDGKLRAAALAQPSGITTNGQELFFVDSEISSIRAAALPPGNTVSTIMGAGLFDFGDVDGPAATARLQHPLGIAFSGGYLFVADTYNHKIKIVDVAKREIMTLAGTGESGARDGEFSEARFSEPGGLAATEKALYVADTGNHLIRRVEMDTQLVTTVDLRSY
ncbi:MAG: thioredoxin-like domain-containing protein [Blastocatellia bacterium]